MPNFEVGNLVKWTSQAQGSAKTKVGTVEAVIPAGRDLTRTQRGELPGAGLARPHVSYLVRVPGATALARSKLYWPVASLLARA